MHLTSKRNNSYYPKLTTYSNLFFTFWSLSVGCYAVFPEWQHFLNYLLPALLLQWFYWLECACVCLWLCLPVRWLRSTKSVLECFTKSFAMWLWLPFRSTKSVLECFTKSFAIDSALPAWVSQSHCLWLPCVTTFQKWMQNECKVLSLALGSDWNYAAWSTSSNCFITEATEDILWSLNLLGMLKMHVEGVQCAVFLNRAHCPVWFWVFQVRQLGYDIPITSRFSSLSHFHTQVHSQLWIAAASRVKFSIYKLLQSQCSNGIKRILSYHLKSLY